MKVDNIFDIIINFRLIHLRSIMKDDLQQIIIILFLSNNKFL